MTAAFFVLASALQLPIADERTSRGFLNRSPRVATKEDVTTIKAELWINEEGKTRDCRLIQFEGSSQIADRMCKRVVGTSFKPARNENGAPVHGLLVETLSVYPYGFRYLSDIQTKALKNELQTVKISLELGETASSSAVPTHINLLILVDEQGRQRQCRSSEDSKAQIVELACEHSTQFMQEIRRSSEGNRVPYVRMLTVEFLVASSQ